MGLFSRLFVFGLFTACTTTSEESPQAEPGVVARIGNTVLQANELRDFAISTPQSLRSKQEGAAARQDYLRSLLVKHLLYLEAQVWELQESMEVQKRIEASWHQHLIEIYRNEQPSIQVEVDEEEIRRYFAENDLGQQRQLAGILVEEESKPKRCSQSSPLAKVSRSWPDNTPSTRGRPPKGVWGYISRQQARRLKIPDEVFRELPVGVLSDILPINKRYLVMRFSKTSPEA